MKSYLYVSKQMTDAKSNCYYYKETVEVVQLARLKIFSTKFINKLWILYVCIKRIWHEIAYTSWYAVKPKQT